MLLTELVAKARPAMTAQPVVLARLPYPPSANRYWRTTAMVVGKQARVQTYISEDAKAYKESVAWLLKQRGVRQLLTGRLQVDLYLLPPCPKDWKTRARKDPLWWADSVMRLDLDNARKVVTDAMKGIAMEDDKQVWRDHGEVLEPVEGEDACVILQLSRLVKDNPQEGLKL